MDFDGDDVCSLLQHGGGDGEWDRGGLGVAPDVQQGSGLGVDGAVRQVVPADLLTVDVYHDATIPLEVHGGVGCRGRGVGLEVGPDLLPGHGFGRQLALEIAKHCSHHEPFDGPARFEVRSTPAGASWFERDLVDITGEPVGCAIQTCVPDADWPLVYNHRALRCRGTFLDREVEGFISMDYDRGLKMLKEWIETGHINSKTEVVGAQSMGPFQVVGVRRKTTLPEISGSMDNAFSDAKSKLEAAGIDTHGEMVSVYRNLNMKTQEVEYTAGLLFGDNVVVPAG